MNSGKDFEVKPEEAKVALGLLENKCVISEVLSILERQDKIRDDFK
jgi:hypothetical protein